MLLSSKDGIICDLCGSIFKENFIYFSVETTKVIVNNNFVIQQQPGQFEKDVCQGCYDLLLDQVKQNLGQYKKGFIKCDLSKTYKNGTFEYYKLLFSKIVVDKNAEPPMLVESKIMDINIINGFDLLVTKASKIKANLAKNEGWS